MNHRIFQLIVITRVHFNFPADAGQPGHGKVFGALSEKAYTAVTSLTYKNLQNMSAHKDNRYISTS
jgi:hypothetical protein